MVDDDNAYDQACDGPQLGGTTQSRIPYLSTAGLQGGLASGDVSVLWLSVMQWLGLNCGVLQACEGVLPEVIGGPRLIGPRLRACPFP